MRKGNGRRQRLLYEDRHELKEAFKNKCWELDMSVFEGLKVAKISMSVWSNITSQGMTPRIRTRMLTFIGEQGDKPKVEPKPTTNENGWYLIEEPNNDEPKKERKKISHLKGSISYDDRNKSEIDTTMKILYTVSGLTQKKIGDLFKMSESSVNTRLMGLLGNDQ